MREKLIQRSHFAMNLSYGKITCYKIYMAYKSAGKVCYDEGNSRYVIVKEGEEFPGFDSKKGLTKPKKKEEDPIEGILSTNPDTDIPSTWIDPALREHWDENGRRRS